MDIPTRISLPDPPPPPGSAKKKSNPFLAFISDHWPLGVCVVAAIGVFLVLPSFQELAYGALRLAVVALVAFLLIHVVFKSTLRPYINSGGFSKDFENLSPQHKTWMTIAVIALILLIATECFTHAASNDETRIDMQRARWQEAQLRPEKVHFIDATVDQIVRARARYESVANATSVPWFVIAAIHNMECGLSFREHLHNGDPLVARTRHVPAGRLPNGRPPFSWEASAIDALRLDKLDREEWTSTGGALQNVEAYNGTGYERFHPLVPTPYLWCWTTIYTRGKYVEDGRWDPLAISQQCGVAALWKRMIATGVL